MRVDVLERVATFTTLGIRFWDPVLDRPIEDGLEATARPEADSRARPVRAVRTLSGALMFQGLPGLRDVENRVPATAAAGSPATRRFVVEVRDASRRFAPVAFAVDLPLPNAGLFMVPGSGSPAGLPGFFLYSGPGRRPPAGMAVVRGQLAVAATERPAAHALVEVEDPDGETWHGIADGAGRFAVILPWPTLAEVAGASSPPASPPPGPAGSLASRTWPIVIRVRHDAAGLAPLPGSELPDLGSVLTQPQTPVWLTDPAAASPPGSPAAAPELAETLVYGAELIARTAGLSLLLVGAASPSP